MPGRYNLRKRGAQSTTWVKDETLKQPDSESEDEDYAPPSESEEEEAEETEDEEEEEEGEEVDSSTLRIPKGAKVSVKLHIHTIAGGKGGRIDVEEESEEESDESEEEDFIGHLMNKYVHPDRR